MVKKTIKQILNKTGDLEPEIMKDLKPVILHYGKIFSDKNKRIQKKLLEQFVIYFDTNFIKLLSI